MVVVEGCLHLLNLPGRGDAKMQSEVMRGREGGETDVERDGQRLREKGVQRPREKGTDT